jgi:general secretion pathway protein B
MSYILDALRKADAQRERDPARGIHAQPAVPMASAGTARRWRWPAWIVGGLLLLAVGAAALWRGEPARPDAGQAGAPAIGPGAVTGGTPPVVGMSPVTAPPPPPVAQSVQPAAPPMPAPPPVVRERTAPPTRVAAAPPSAAVPPTALPSPAPATPPATAVTATPKGAAQPSAAGAPAPAPERVVAMAELPPDVQRELPKLAISGGVYSDNPAQRMLIVGGLVVNEGAEVAPGVRLEEIRAKTAVLRFRNYRYSVGY